MRRVLILSACFSILLGSVQIVEAVVTDKWAQGELIPISPTRNLIRISIVADETWPEGGVMTSLEGTWSCEDIGASFYLGGSDPTAWKAKTKNVDSEPQPAPYSYVNFDTITSSALIWAHTGTLPNTNVTSFGGSWYTTEPTYRLSPSGRNLLADMYVDNGMWVRFTGKANWAVGTETVSESFTFLVPEPGALAMLIGAGLALVGMGLARLRRR
jgi:hypothetical protein